METGPPEKYREVCGEPKRSRNKGYLQKRFALRIQELADEASRKSEVHLIDFAAVPDESLPAPKEAAGPPQLRAGGHVRPGAPCPRRLPRPASSRPPRVAHTLALALHVRAAIAQGTFVDQAAVARALGLTRARVTQLLALLLLAPDVQAAVVALEAIDGVEPVTERRLRAVTRHARGDRQRAERQRFVATGGLCGRRRSRVEEELASPPRQA